MRLLLRSIAVLLQPICLLLGTATYFSEIVLLRAALEMHDGDSIGVFIGSCMAYFMIASAFFHLTVWSVRILTGAVPVSKSKRRVELQHIREVFAVHSA